MSGLSATERAIGKYAGAAFAKEKEQSRQSREPDHEGGESQGQQPPQRDGVVPDPVWVGSKWLLDFPRVPVTPGTPLFITS